MIDRSAPRGRIVAAALDLAAQRPWNDVTYLDIAGAAGLDLAGLRREFRAKGDMLAAFARMVDDHVLATAPKPLEGQSARDRLFDVVMSRFEALAPFKAALRSIAGSGAGSFSLVGQLIASQTWMLRAAGIGTDGAGGALRVAGLAGLYASVFRVWLRDDDPSLGKTMAALDRGLRQGEQTFGAIACVASLCKPSRGGEPRPSAPEEPRPAASPASPA